MSEALRYDPETEWLDHVRPTGLVLSPSVLRELNLTPERQSAIDSAPVKALLHEEGPALGADPWPFFAEILGWPEARVFGIAGQPACPGYLDVSIADRDTFLSPTWAVRNAGADEGVQLLVVVQYGVKLDEQRALPGWEASAQQRFERLLRETNVAAGVLVGEEELRLVYAPKGEASGWIAWPLRSLDTVAGRAMLGGLKLALGAFSLFNQPKDLRLPALLAKSRDAQTSVSTKLAEQVLGALHALLRAFDTAETDMVRELARVAPAKLYEGLLSVLMRLIFVLYAEDRELLPSANEGPMRRLYDDNYSVRSLLAQLRADAAAHADTMGERVGAWGRLLALFRLIHEGHPSGWIQARGGKLFDPDAFPFLEGRGSVEEGPRVVGVSDGAVREVLEALMVLDGERLSYRTLDVEQIGSVYETVIGFTVETAKGPVIAIKAGKNNKVPVFVELEALRTTAAGERLKWLKENTERGKFGDARDTAIRAAHTVDQIAAAFEAGRAESVIDERGSPQRRIAQAGTPYLQPTDERRRTGSHYTPRSLTKPIVEHALEPAFERIGENATPEEVLALKICDPAMGSGAFLVEACRALATRLVQAWARHEGTRPVIPPDEDEDLHARRLVAQRCLYGVDKNPMATDLAKLSLWLATLAKDHEFTFLDHALKSGDSLVGLSVKQIAACKWDADKPSHPLIREIVESKVAEALAARRRIAEAPEDTPREAQEAIHAEAEEKLETLRNMGDAICAAFFRASKAKERERLRVELEQPFAAGDQKGIAAAAQWSKWFEAQEHPFRPFHWELEFPEVFDRDNPGFDAIVGNPPFAGKNTLAASTIDHYPAWLQAVHSGAHGNSDVVAHFFRRSFSLTRIGGAFGLIATNTIGQGDTRQSGLTWLLSNGCSIYRATRRIKWPGEAAVIVSLVHVLRTGNRPPLLNDTPVRRISAYLVEGDLDTSPSLLKANEGQAFVGTYALGLGFVFDDDDAGSGVGQPTSLSEMRRLKADATNERCIKSYLGGDDVNSTPMHTSKRYIIDFGEMSEDEAKRWPELFDIVSRKVKPARLAQNDDGGKRRWWQFLRTRPELYSAIARKEWVIVRSLTSAHFPSFVRVATGPVFDQTLIVWANGGYGMLACLCSSVHEVWCQFLGGTLEDRGRYNVEDCFQTFPLPADYESNSELLTAGRAYDDHRAAIMLGSGLGLTFTYNRFHNHLDQEEAIARLRDLRSNIDVVCLRAFGWTDLIERCQAEWLNERNEQEMKYQNRFFWPTAMRDEVLARLLALNAERAVGEATSGAS